MSIKVQSYVWENSKATGSSLLLLLAIADFAHDDGGGAWPSLDTLAHKCRQSVRNVQYLLEKLTGLGELKIRPDAGPNGTNVYTIVLPANFACRKPLDKAKTKTPAPDFTPDMQTSADSSCKPARQISPKPLGIIIEPSLNLSKARETESEEFAAMFQTIEIAMGGELRPKDCELLKELWEDKPILRAHHYAYLQTRERADAFNLPYYSQCVRSYRGTDKQNEFVREAARRESG